MTAQPDKLLEYQLAYLQGERDLFMGDAGPLAVRIFTHPAFRFVTRHLQNLYWTATRLIGLGHWHDGSPRRPLSARPVLQNAAPLQRPRILIDLTQTFNRGGQTGIQRVMREIAKVAAESGSGLPVIIRDGKFVPYYQHATDADNVEIAAGDVLLLLDAVWYRPDIYLPMMQEVLQKGGRLVIGVHDLVPLQYPWVHEASVESLLRDWFERAIPMADGVVAVSRSVADELRDYIAAAGIAHKPHLGIGWRHLGADFAADGSAPASQTIMDICSGVFFLSVGTIEPRKAYPVALAAFEKLWSAGSDVRYLIVGRYGWNAAAVRKRILEHPEYGRRLFWLDRASDADLSYAYRHARSLVYPSFAEGFGLPLIEAARYGTPVIASDIPVFREIGGDAVSYFDVLDPESLAARIRDAVKGKSIKPSFPVLTWQEAAEGFLRFIRNGDYQYSAGMQQASALPLDAV